MDGNQFLVNDWDYGIVKEQKNAVRKQKNKCWEKYEDNVKSSRDPTE